MFNFTYIILLILLQISPGKLSESHKNLEGVDNCLKCHAVAQKITNDKCLNCHTEIKNLISNEKGYHYFVKDENCANCHKEHFGRNFKLVNFDEKSFDHNLTKFKLEGAHAKLKCSSCHNQKFFKGEKYKNGTFLGLGTKCLDCHQDAHMGQLSQNCLECHTFEKWDLALKTFNHDKARFKLTGLHKNVNCYSCHPKSKSGNVLFTVFKNLIFSSCSNCHNDFHKGKFGECEKCHSTTGWQNLKIKFDHNLTDYKLDGMHNLLKCEKCHNKVKKIKNESDYISNFKITHKICLDCHTYYHGGVFMKRKSKGDCSDCHNTSGFALITFTTTRHNLETRFKLTDSHLTIPCFKCHRINNTQNFYWINLLCQSCHIDNHGNQFANDKGETYCERCHKTTKWDDLKFNHNETKFKLDGKHNQVPCNKCHYEKLTVNNFQFVKYVNTPLECESCHKDIHLGQFASNNSYTDCSRCHTPEGWKELKFNHNTDSKFKLTGAHEKLECQKCHKIENSPVGNFTRYKPLPINCEGCHAG